MDGTHDGPWLLFDGGCAACSSVAREIALLAGDDLELMALTSLEANALLKRAGVTQPKDVPYLVTRARDGGLTASTGAAMAAQASRLLGPRKALKVGRLAKQAHQQRLGSSRRRLLKTGMAAGLLGAIGRRRVRPLRHAAATATARMSPR